MNTAVALKCLMPDVMDSWQEFRDIETAAYDAKCDAFQKAIGGATLIGTRFYRGGFQVTGYQMASHSEELPKGWRREAHSYNAVPAKRTAEGKAIAAELRELYLPDHNYPGVPKWLHCDGFSIFPSVHKIGNDWWLTMGKKPYDKDMEGFDATLWAPAKLSEYYAAKEKDEQP